jgi:hypothetical protein
MFFAPGVSQTRSTMKNRYLFESIGMPKDAMPHQSCSDEADWLEQVFHECLLRWQEVKTSVFAHGFQSEEEELFFFKYTKPGFIGFLNYYSKRYQSLVFRPHGNNEQISFYQKEIIKSEKFRLDHSEFYYYYTSGRKDRDREYFRSVPQDAPCAFEKIHNADKNLTSAKDWLVANFITNSLYHSYLLQLISACSV